MQQTDRDNPTFADDPIVNINVPPLGIDLRRIFLSLRGHIPHREITFGTNNGDVVIPTLSWPFRTIPNGEFLVIKEKKMVKIPMILEDNNLSVETIDLLVAWLEYRKINNRFRF